MVKERREPRGRGGDWGVKRLIGAHTQNIYYLSTVTTQHKSRQRCVRRLLMRIKARGCAEY